ncbi:MAG: GAP family protein [Solirubrobacterales bacterium]
MGRVLFFSVTAAFNPTLLAATTVMLLLPKPKRLLLGYLCGAMVTSVTLGLVIVFSLQGSGSVSTAQNTLSPASDFALGGILLLIALVLASGRDEGLRERRRRKKESKPQKEPRWKTFLSKGSARDTFVVGALLTLPGGSYLAGLDAIAKQDLSTVETVLTVLGFNVVMLALLELPLIGYALAPDWTPKTVERFKAWIARRGRRVAIYGCAGIGAALVVRGLIELLS